MKVLITGSQGMMGTALTSILSQSVRVDTVPVSRTECDLADRSAFLRLLSAKSPDLIVHFAAKVAGIGESSKNPASLFAVNQAIDHAVIWGALEARTAGVLLIGTSSMYPPSEDPIPETALLQGFPDLGNYGYSLSKALSSKLAILLNELGQTAFRILVAPNLYGPHDRTDTKSAHLLGAIVSKALEAKTKSLKSIDMWGDGTARREFLFATDLARYIADYALHNFDRLPHIMNVGSGRDFSVLEWYRFVTDACGWSGRIIPDPSRPSGAMRKILDSSIAIQMHAWEPSTPPHDGIKTLLTERGISS